MSTDVEAPKELLVSDEHETHEPDDAVEVRRDGPLSAIVGGLAGVVSLAYLTRAASSGSLLDWLLCVVVGVVALLHLAMLMDSRSPLMVLDRHGVRLRRGREWQGVAWPEVERTEHLPRETMLHDGRLTVVDVDGREFSVRLSLSTRLVGADWHELTDALVDLNEGRTDVVEVDHDDHPAPVVGPAVVEPPVVEEGALAPVSKPPLPLRIPIFGRRAEVVLDREPVEPVDQDAITEVGHVVPLETSEPFDVSETSTIVIDEAVLGALPDPVVGPQLAEARIRLGLSVDQLAERTRIRPHVIEAIEVDDFVPCGGDFYARGHLRTLARILGVEATPLLDDYDVRYADAPIDPRSVFQAELATGPGGSMRGTRGGLNWSVLIAAVMAVVLVWSIARLVMDGPVPLSDRPILNGSPGGKAALSGSTVKVPVAFTAATGGARVIVRDGNQEVVFDEQVAFMQTAKVAVVPPVRISSSDGGLVVTIDGADEGPLGATGEAAQDVFVPDK